MTRRRFVWLTLLIVLVAATFGWYRFGPRDVPPGQPPLARLTSGTLESLREDFNRSVDQVRVIVLLSPT